MKLAAGLVALVAAGWAQPADVIYHNGKIVTLWNERRVAQAVATRGDRILKVGTDAEVLATGASSTQKVDLRGRTILPGLNDSHTHPIGAALSEQDGPVPVMRTIAEIQTYVREQSAKLPPGRLIFVPKVYSTRLRERRYPTREDLDSAATDRDVIVDNGYASVLNTRALRTLNIARDTPQPANGKILKDERGEPTGLVLGARQLIRPLAQSRRPTPADLLWAIDAMHKRYSEVGITSTIDRGQGAEGFRAYQESLRRGAMRVRTYVTYTISAQGTPAQVRQEIERIPFVTGWGDEWLRVGSLKTVIDGGILIGTAYLREPYGTNTRIYGYDDPDYRGVLNVPKENVFEMARAAAELGWQMTAHSTGGGSTDILLDAYEAADRTVGIRDRRFTVTHGNFPNAEAIARARKLGVAFDCQPAWHHLDGPALKDVFGPSRTSHFLPLRSMLDAGLVVAGGSDHMIRFDSREAINPYNPFFGMWMAITRRTADGAVLHPEQRVTREEALRMWTIQGAYLSFEEKIKGSIEPGKLADLVVVSKDFLTCPEDDIKDIEALLTVVGGKVTYRSPRW